MPKFTHSVMPHSLAKALIESSIQHFDAGGMVAPPAVPQSAVAPSQNGGPVMSFLSGQSGYSANLAPTQQSNYGGVINDAATNALGGYGTYQGILTQQQALADALLARSRGEGANPAQAALNQATGANVAQTGALLGGQRGASGNVGLMARQIGQAGAGIQQQAVGQGATMQAQQEIAAQQSLAQQQASMQTANQAEQGTNAALFTGAAGAQTAQNNTNVANYGKTQEINAGTSQANAKQGGGLIGGALNAVGGFLGLAKGGKVPEHLHKMASIYHPELAASVPDFRAGGKVPGTAPVAGDSIKNDIVPAMLSPGEQVLPRSVTQAKDAPKRAADFVKHLQEKEDRQTGYGKIASGRKTLKARVEHLEKMFSGGKVAPA